MECVVVPSWAKLQVAESKLPLLVFGRAAVPPRFPYTTLFRSETVVVQVEPSLIGTVEGEQVTFVEVDRLAPLTVEPVASELVACSELQRSLLESVDLPAADAV